MGIFKIKKFFSNHECVYHLHNFSSLKPLYLIQAMFVI